MFETTTGTQARSIPISQWQFKAGFTNEKPKVNEHETTEVDMETSDDEEGYYSPIDRDNMEEDERELESEIEEESDTRQLDFVLAYTQADIERDLYMKLPPGFTVPGRVITDQDRKDYVLKLEKNLYGQKQAGRVTQARMQTK